MCEARRVLVVEDMPAVRQLLVLTLAEEGYTVHTAVHGADALRLLETLAPCLILLDLRMPVMDGAAFARAYHRRPDADAHLVVLTAEGRAEQIRAIGPAAVVRKLFDLDRLLEVVARWVAAHRPPADEAATPGPR
jgi:CheY-like chemotaxis protein